jgi:hypothetical protein
VKLRLNPFTAVVVRVTGEENVPEACNVTVEVVCEPWITLIVVGEIEMLKSPPDTMTWIKIFTAWLSEPLVPTTLSV